MAERDAIKVFCRNCHAKLDVTDLEPFSHVECPECGTVLRVPKRFDRYLLEKVCGIGGMSKVYRALEPELARRVAVKILNEESEENDGGRRFLEEAKLVAKINHPGVIPIYNCGVAEGRPFLVMRYMENGSVGELLRRDGLADVSMTAGWMANIAEGLEFALRQQSVVHHDIKPGNILLTSEWEAKLGDFDLADVRETGDALTLCDGWASPGYVSPERLLYGGEDYRGDIFSLGVTIYEAMTKLVPFGVKGTPEELLDRRANPHYPELCKVNKQVTPEFSALVGRMLSYLPEQRPEYREIIAGLKLAAVPETEGKDEGEGLVRKLSGWFRR